MGTCIAVPFEAIAALRRRLTAFLPRHPERLLLMDSTAGLYEVSRVSMCDHFDGKPVEIRQLLRGSLKPQRSTELIGEMRAVGLPL